MKANRWYVCNDGCNSGKAIQKSPPFDGRCPFCQGHSLTRVSMSRGKQDDGLLPLDLRMYDCSLCGAFEHQMIINGRCPKCGSKGIVRVDKSRGHWTDGSDCPQCGGRDSEVVPQTFKNGKTHFRFQCARCHKFFKFVSPSEAKLRESAPLNFQI